MKILILGGDERYNILINGLKLNHDVDSFGFNDSINLEDIDIKKYNVVILPVSGISNNYEIKTLNGLKKLDNDFFKYASGNLIIYTGIVNDTLKSMINGRNLISFLADEKVNNENNDITVDGIINELEKYDFNNICILGYGNIGKRLDEKLKGYNLVFGIKEYSDYCTLKGKCFYTCNPNTMKIAFAESDCIINTVPQNIITKEMLEGCKAKIIDVSSFPYGASKEVRESFKNYGIYPGIPAKYNPSRSGKILLKKIQKEIGG